MQLSKYETITRNGQQINDFRLCNIYGTKTELDYFIQENIEKEQIKVLRKNRTRATTYIKTYPNVILQERNITTFDAIE
jgi:hypothetical protein